MKHKTLQLSIIILALASAAGICGQVRNTVFTQGKIVTTFNDNVDKVEKISVQPDLDKDLGCPLITYKENGQRYVVNCKATLSYVNAITLTNFSTPLIPAAEHSRTYFIRWEGLQFQGDSRGAPVETEIEINSMTRVPPNLNIGLPSPDTVSFDPSRRKIEITPNGFIADDLYQILKDHLEQITVNYRFAKDDPAPDIKTGVENIALKTPHTSTGTGNPRTIILTAKRPLPYRPKKYTVSVSIPWKLLRGKITVDKTDGNDYEIPAKDVDAKDENDVLATAGKIELISSEPERKNSEFAFEAVYISQVKTDKTKRTDVGVFGVTIKPTIGLRSFGTGRGERNPGWVALRPSFDADIDTQRPGESSSPNRLLFGFDVELGKSFTGPKINGEKSNGFLRQLVWTNGVRYDNDRDFKLQTLYWRTEMWLRFKNFEQSFVQRLYRFNLKKSVEDTQKEPFLSSYYVRPTFGYELGSTLRRDSRSFEGPTRNISRPFIHFAAGIEIERLLKLNLNDTYYYLPNAPSFKNRNFLETTFEVNTGRLYSTDLVGLSNAIFLKFQRGNEPPTFKHVNIFSIGFKIYK